MNKIYLITSALILLFIPIILTPVYSANAVKITDDLSYYPFGNNIEYLVDSEGSLSFKDVLSQGQGWVLSEKDNLNFGLTRSVHWFRFTVNNQKTSSTGWYFEIDYPHLDSISLYYPLSNGKYVEKNTGDMLPFSSRDIEDRKFIFNMDLPSGISEIYFKCKTTGSLKFTPAMLSYPEFTSRTNHDQLVYGIYFGIILVMIIYNLFLFISIRELSYLTFSVYLLMFILYDGSMAGFTYQFLWPESPWLANNLLPVFMSQCIAWVSLFCAYYVESPKRNPLIFKFTLFTVTIPTMLAGLLVFSGNLTLSLQINTICALFGCIMISIAGIILLIKKNKKNMVLMTATIPLLIGVISSTLDASGVIPSMFITKWGFQIGIIMLILILSFGLAHNVNTMKSDLIKLNVDLKENEALALQRAKYLENAVINIKSISQELYKVGSELSSIGASFENLASEQASTSEEMAASFEELINSNEQIYGSTVTQSEETKKTRGLAEVLTESQDNVAQATGKVLESISFITKSVKDTGESLAFMVERMEYIDQGGKAIDGITVMIDDITDRINLLSLNAAIEAARAGNHGKGFAVVADEIGKLAMATSENSKEISTQLKNMIQDINTGKSIVDKIKVSINTIFSYIDEINNHIEESKNVFNSQGKAVNEVREQSSLVETLSNDIARATNEHRVSMEDNIKIVNRLAEIAQEVAQSTITISNSTNIIGEKSRNLEGLIEEIT